MAYTNAEFVDMLEMYFVNGKSNRRARNAYALKYPNRRIPNEKTFLHTVQRLRDFGCFKPHTQDNGRDQTLRVRNVEEGILNTVYERPETSTRRLAAEYGVSQSTVNRMLHMHSLHPYHVQKVQALLPTDRPKRIQFCQWILEKYYEDPQFLSHVIFTDEAGFTREGIFNSHNTHIWSDENPHVTREFHYQQQFSINVWAGIAGNQLLGPHELPRRLNGDTYLEFLNTTFQDFLEDVPLNVRRNMWLQHDGAPPHSSRRVTQWLNNTFGNKWIGRYGPVPWPARSPDLTPCDFYLWGHMKQIVYSTPTDSIQDLRQRVENAATQIRNRPEIFENVKHSLLRRARACLDADGGHFEHLL